MAKKVNVEVLAARFGRHVKSCREQLQMTQPDFAAMLNVDVQTVRRLEYGKHPAMVGKHADAVASSLGLDVSHFFTDGESPNVSTNKKTRANSKNR